MTPWDWLAGLSTLFGLGAAPWVCWPDGVIISIWSGQPGSPIPMGLGVLGLVPLLSPRHLQTLGLLGPEVSIRGSAGGLIIGFSGVPMAWVAYLLPPSPGSPPGGTLELCLGSPLAQVFLRLVEITVSTSYSGDDPDLWVSGCLFVCSLLWAPSWGALSRLVNLLPRSLAGEEWLLRVSEKARGL